MPFLLPLLARWGVAERFRRLLGWIIPLALIALLLGALLAVRSCQSGGAAKTAAKLATGQRSAAIESGHDAVDSIGNVLAGADARQATVMEGKDAIDQRPGGDSNDAAERAACRLRSYRHSVKCIALLGPVAE
ncbi:MAG: hypothetical protein V4564_08585 [Pseudomonadota bacterium]